MQREKYTSPEQINSLVFKRDVWVWFLFSSAMFGCGSCDVWVWFLRCLGVADNLE
jgi:hypothetical protein